MAPEENLIVSSFLFLLPVVYNCFLCLDDANSERRKGATPSADGDDSYYLQRAHQLRLALTKPRLSQFRVVALLRLDNGKFVLGTNDEQSPSVCGALCAERTALAEYRRQYNVIGEEEENEGRPKIESIYIVSDASIALSPGTLCREYMMGHEATDPEQTRIVMQSADVHSEPWVSTLKELYPFPSVYNKLSVHDQLERGQSMAPLVQALLHNLEIIHGITTTSEHVRQLFAKAVAAARENNRDNVFQIQYGAAAMVRRRPPAATAAAATASGATTRAVASSSPPTTKSSSGVIMKKTVLDYVTASQLLTLEYGASQDALCQLYARLSPQDAVVAIVQVDQFGIPHAPFAAARSVYVEHGMGHIPVIVLEEFLDDEGVKKSRLVSITMSELKPHVPDFRA